MGLHADIKRGLQLHMEAFSDEAENSGYTYAWIDDNFDPSSATQIWLGDTLFTDPVIRGAVGRGGLRRQTGRYQININAPVGNGDTEITAIAERLLDWYEPNDNSPITENTTSIRIGAVDQSNSLPWTREPVTDGNWRTKPVIIPFWADYFPS